MLKELFRPRFLGRGIEIVVKKGESISSAVSSCENRVWYVVSGSILETISCGGGCSVTVNCEAGELGGIVNVCSPQSSDCYFELEPLEESVLYGWNEAEFNLALGLFQELATATIKRLSFILREVNAVSGVKGAVTSQNPEDVSLLKRAPLPESGRVNTVVAQTDLPEVDTERIEMELMEFAFSEINDSSVQIFDKLGLSLSDGDIVFTEGSDGRELYILLDGTVEIVESAGTGNEKVLATLKRGEIFGEMSHFDDALRSATARSKGDSKLIAFSRDNFSLIFQLHPKWTTQLVYGLCERIRQTALKQNLCL